MDLRDNNEPVRLNDNNSPLVIEEKKVPLRDEAPPPPKPKTRNGPRQLSKEDELKLALIILAAAIGLIVMRLVFHEKVFGS